MPSSESRPTNSASVSSSWGGQAVKRSARNVATAAVHTATAGANIRSAIVPRGGAKTLSDATASATTAAYPGSLSANADLRVPLPEGTPLRALPTDGRPAAQGLRGVRREAAREGAAPRSDLLQGQGLLLDRLRAEGAEARLLGRREGEVPTTRSRPRRPRRRRPSPRASASRASGRRPRIPARTSPCPASAAAAPTRRGTSR